MSFSLAETKAMARRAAHSAMAYDGEYMDDLQDVPAAVRVRCHNRLVRQFGMPGEGMTETIGAIDRLVFNREELADANLTIIRGGRVTISAWGDAVFVLDQRDAYDGPINEVWTVTRADE